MCVVVVYILLLILLKAVGYTIIFSPGEIVYKQRTLLEQVLCWLLTLLCVVDRSGSGVYIWDGFIIRALSL